MITKKQWFWTSFLLSLCIGIHLFSANADWVENYYTNGSYPVLTEILRYTFGWLPFSIGDIVYGVVFIWLVYKMIYGIKLLYQKKVTGKSFKQGLMKWITVLLALYLIFNLFWGINYDRKGIAQQLGLQQEKYTLVELKYIDSLLLKKANESKAGLLKKNESIKTDKEIFSGAINAYSQIQGQFPFLAYRARSVKRSYWGWLGNYLNFTGYYNPFTGEAQINTTVPKFLQPYTTCHEMAHQLGYAKENEANFVGYLAASASKDTLFNYSVYLDLFMYANRTLWQVDSSAAKNFAHQLLPEIKMDLKEWRIFMLRHQNPIEPGIKWLYGKFLQGNGQPSGMLTYDEVTGLLIAYEKKYGKI